MLLNLQILNGTLSLKFDPYHTKYTVFLNNFDDMMLEFQYQVSEGTEVVIQNNFLNQEYTEVTLTATKEDISTDYTFYVYKEDTTNVLDYSSIFQPVEVEKKEISPYAVPGIASACFFIILILFAILFHKKKKK